MADKALRDVLTSVCERDRVGRNAREVRFMSPAAEIAGFSAQVIHKKSPAQIG